LYFLLIYMSDSITLLYPKSVNTQEHSRANPVPMYQKIVQELLRSD